MLLLCWVSTTLTRDASEECDVIYPGTDYNSVVQSEYYLEDTIIVTYYNCDNYTFFSVWCSDSDGGVAGDNIWKGKVSARSTLMCSRNEALKAPFTLLPCLVPSSVSCYRRSRLTDSLHFPVLDGKGYLGPNASVPIKLQRTGKEYDVGSCGFGIGTTNNTLPWDAVFKLQNKPRPGGPLTFGLEKKISDTYTGSDYAPFTKLDEVDPYAGYNGVATVEAEFVTLSSSSSGTTTTSSTTSPTSSAQATTTQSGFPSLNTSSAGGTTNADEGSGAKKGGLSTGAIAGIGAGAAVLVIAIAALAFFFFWRRRKNRLAARSDANNAPGEGEGQDQGAGYLKAELEDNPKPHGNELDGSNEADIKDKPHELGPGTERHELGSGGEGEGWQGRVELP